MTQFESYGDSAVRPELIHCRGDDKGSLSDDPIRSHCSAMDSFLGAGHGLDAFHVRRYLTYYEDCNLIEGSDRHTG